MIPVAILTSAAAVEGGRGGIRRAGPRSWIGEPCRLANDFDKNTGKEVRNGWFRIDAMEWEADAAGYRSAIGAGREMAQAARGLAQVHDAAVVVELVDLSAIEALQHENNRVVAGYVYDHCYRPKVLCIDSVGNSGSRSASSRLLVSCSVSVSCM